MLKSIKQIIQESGITTQLGIKCDFCEKDIDLQKDMWVRQDDGTYIHLDCVLPSLENYKAMLDELVPTQDFKLLSKLDPREPFSEGWHETCEFCGHITDSPFETHVCPERV